MHSNGQCECTSSHGLYVKNRQLSWVVASVILLNFCLFMGGYFLGQKNAVSDFSDKIEQESFSDQIYSSMCSLCDSGEVEESSENEEEVTENDEQAPESAEEESSTSIQAQNSVSSSIIDTSRTSSHALVLAADSEPDESQQADEQAQEVNEADTQYYAQLIGFGSARTAQKFAHKLSRKEIPVVVKKRQSRTARGRFVSWYQVVTEKFNDRQELEALIARLEREEKITGVQIATC